MKEGGGAGLTQKFVNAFHVHELLDLSSGV